MATVQQQEVPAASTRRVDVSRLSGVAFLVLFVAGFVVLVTGPNIYEGGTIEEYGAAFADGGREAAVTIAAFFVLPLAGACLLWAVAHMSRCLDGARLAPNRTKHANGRHDRRSDQHNCQGDADAAPNHPSSVSLASQHRTGRHPECHCRAGLEQGEIAEIVQGESRQPTPCRQIGQRGSLVPPRKYAAGPACPRCDQQPRHQAARRKEVVP